MNLDRVVFILILILFSFDTCASSSSNCAFDKMKIDSLNQLFRQISTVENQVFVEYDTLKSTFNIKVYNSEKLWKSYKLIVSDIHPEGIYFIEIDGKFNIRIISRCAGNVFIETSHKQGVIHSKTTNRLILSNYSQNAKKDISLICSLIQSMVLD